MRALETVGLIAAPTTRTRAYLQMFEARGVRPAKVFRIPGAEFEWQGDAEVNVPVTSPQPPSQGSDSGFAALNFRPGEAIGETCARMGCETVDLPEVDINNPGCIEMIANSTVDIVIYSGLPKALLSQALLANGKRYLHVHGGYLPAYRGATGFYFGLLEQGWLGNTAIWVNEGVDSGPIVSRRWYRPGDGLDVDHIMDPVTRADLLLEVLQQAERTGAFPSLEAEEETPLHYIIHPVLKHLALRRAQ